MFAYIQPFTNKMSITLLSVVDLNHFFSKFKLYYETKSEGEISLRVSTLLVCRSSF